MAKSGTAEEAGAPPTAAAAAAGKTAGELMSKLRRLVRAITDDCDGRIETYKEASRVLEALTALQFNGNNGNPNANSNAKRPSPLSQQKTQPQKQNQIEPVEIPDQFLCPISSELMKDPVVLAATGETYDRPFIEEWLNSGKRSCPRTQQILSDLTLVPNNVLRRIISQWCADHGMALPPVDNPDESLITKNDRIKLNALLNTISTKSSSALERKHAVRELRLLTKVHPSHRAALGESPDAIPKLLWVVTSRGLDGDPGVQEDVVTTIMNLSIHDSNKKTIGEDLDVILFLISSLKMGTMETRGNAAAALFTLSALDSNKKMIGESGAMRSLVELLERGGPGAKRDAASAIFNLCMYHDNRGRAVVDNAVRVLIKCIDDGSLVDESLAILAMLASNQEAVDEMGAKGGVACVMRIMRESSCGKNRENAAVVLFSMCMNDRTKMREVREEEELNGTISRLVQNGTSRARRKATGILDRLKRMHSSHNSC